MAFPNGREKEEVKCLCPFDEFVKMSSHSLFGGSNLFRKYSLSLISKEGSFTDEYRQRLKNHSDFRSKIAEIHSRAEIQGE